MLLIMLVAVGIALRPRRFWEPLALGAAVLLPWWASLAGIGIVMWIARRGQRTDPYQEVAYLQAISAELRSGRSLRHALVEAAVRAPGLDLANVTRLARSGRPMKEVARSAREALPGTGRLTAAAMRIGAESGGAGGVGLRDAVRYPGRPDRTGSRDTGGRGDSSGIGGRADHRSRLRAGTRPRHGFPRRTHGFGLDRSDPGRDRVASACLRRRGDTGAG